MNIKKHAPLSKLVQKIFFDCFFNPLSSLINHFLLTMKSNGGNNVAVSAITLGDENFNVTVPAAGGTATITNAPSAVASNIMAVKVNIAADANASIKIGNTPFTQGQTVDFSAPVTFTVTAQDGTVKSYVINIPAYHATANPYGIYTVKHLVNVAKGLTASYLLKNNIDLPNKDDAAGAAATGISDYASKGWLPLGTSSAFTGTFDGGNFSINNFYVNREMEYAGLFGLVGKGSVVKNLGVNGVITGTAARGKYVGILAGLSKGIIDKCYATGSVSSSSYAGGLVGHNDSGSISNSYATGSVASSSSDSARSSAGGLAGGNDHGCSISNSYATGSVSASSHSSHSSAGGLVGYNSNIDSISNSYATGNVSSSSWSYYSSSAGGLVGRNRGTISNSYATGSASSSSSRSSDFARSSSSAGGLAGDNYSGSIINSYATGSVSATSSDTASDASSDAYAGGLVGYNKRGAISNSYATGSVSATSSDAYAGGLAGSNKRGSISNSYATGSVSTTTSSTTTFSFAGGLVGANYDSGSISNSYATGSVSASSADASTAYAGGLAGRSNEGTHNCYRNSNVAITKNGQTVTPNDASIAGITAKTKAEMQTDDFKGDLNVFGNTWGRSKAKNDKLPFIIGVGAGK